MTRWVFNEDGWTDWIDHDGNGCPCVGWWVHLVIGDVDGETPEGLDWDGPGGINDYEWQGVVNKCSGSWTYDEEYFPVIKYRVRKPKGAEMLERLVQDVPEPVDA